MRFVFIFILFNFFGSFVFSQMIGMDPMMLNNLMDIQSGRSQKTTLEQVEAMFIEEIFVKHIMDSNEVFKFDEDDEDDILLDTSMSNDMFNAIYIRQVSKMLAKQDLLGFSKYKVPE